MDWGRFGVGNIINTGERLVFEGDEVLELFWLVWFALLLVGMVGYDVFGIWYGVDQITMMMEER